MTKEFEKYLNKIRNNISSLYNRFYVLKSLKNKNYETTYNKNKYFWGIILFSLENDFFVNLSKLYGKDNLNFSKSISIHNLIDFVIDTSEKTRIQKKIQKHQKVIDNLKKWRNKIFAHEDEKVFLNIEKFYQKYPIKPEELENLLKLAEEIIGDVDSSVNNISKQYEFLNFKNESKRDVEDIIKKLK